MRVKYTQSRAPPLAGAGVAGVGRPLLLLWPMCSVERQALVNAYSAQDGEGKAILPMVEHVHDPRLPQRVCCVNKEELQETASGDTCTRTVHSG